jgi:hypothetical protein
VLVTDWISKRNPRSLGRRNFSAQIAEKPVSFGDTFCVHSYGYELEGITKRSSPFGNLNSKISTAQTPSDYAPPGTTHWQPFVPPLHQPGVAWRGLPAHG